VCDYEAPAARKDRVPIRIPGIVIAGYEHACHSAPLQQRAKRTQQLKGFVLLSTLPDFPAVAIEDGRAGAGK
jgi:hypothetical protein